VSNGHDQLTIKLKIKVDKDLQHYDVEKDEDSSECSKDEKWDEQHSNIKNGKESKETKESSWKESSTVTTIVKPEVKLNPSSITKIVEKLPIAASTQKTITTSLPIITSSSLSPSTFIVTSNVPKETKAE
jgi:AAA15 family ATPase/GTPase